MHQKAMPRNDPDLDTLIIDTVGSVVCVTDHEGRIIRFNDAATRILGYEAEEVYGRVLWDIFPMPENRARSQGRLARLLGGETLEFEAVWLTKAGAPRHLAFICRGAPGPSGRFEYTIGTATDITDRVMAERALRESERRFRTSFADASVAMVMVDGRGRFLQVNRAYCEMTGYSAAELLGTDLFAITHPDDRDRNRDLFAKLLAGDRPSHVFEKRYVARSGETLTVKVSASIIGDGNPSRPVLLGLFENVSDRARAVAEREQAHRELQSLNETLEQRVAERTAALAARTDDLARSRQALEDERRILRSVLDSMGDAVIVADADARVMLVNPAAERIAGPRDPTAVYVEDCARRKRGFYRDDGVTAYAPHELPLARAVRGEAVDDEEMLVVRPDGGEVWLSITTRPLRDEGGAIRGGVLVGRDVTERRRNQAALEAVNLSLAEANVSLRERERHFKELAESNLRLAREVEHRVRNNLAALVGLVLVMRDRAPSVPAFADAIAGRLEAMRHVQQLLAERRWSSINLRELVDGALAALRHAASCATDVDVVGPDVLIGPARVLPLTLVLVEWFTNSCKHGAHSMPGGRVTIGWALRPSAADRCNHIRLTWTEQGGPPVRSPVRPSLGTELVMGFVGRELSGTCELRYPPRGADHTIEFPLTEPRDSGN